MAKGKTKAERKYHDGVAALGCIICGHPANVHHCGTGMGRRKDHMQVIPLCPFHHTGGEHGIALHAGKKAWELKYGTEDTHLETVQLLLGAKDD